MERLKANKEDHSSIKASLDLRHSELPKAELLPQLPDVVKFGQEFFKRGSIHTSIYVPVYDSMRAGRNASKYRIVQLNVKVVETSHRTVAAEISEKELRHRQNCILVKEVQDKGRDRDVFSSTML